MISIVIPVYNAEGYLDCCLKSIVSQTYNNWEVILIDDGSKDSSGKICDRYEKDFQNIKCLHKKNGGVSSARNAGIEHAKGEWLFFCDADDMLMPGALEKMATEANRHQTEFLMFGYEKVSETGKSLLKKIEEKDKVINRNKALMEMFRASDYPYQGYLWCKLFRRNIITENHISFDENISFNEDRLFIIEYLSKVKSDVFYTTYPVYKYIERSNSAMGSLSKGYNKKFASDFDAFFKIYRCLKKDKGLHKYLKYAKTGMANSYENNHKMMLKHHDYIPEIHKNMFRKLFSTGAWRPYLKKHTSAYMKSVLLLIYPKILTK